MPVFADTGFWLALLSKQDSLHPVARRLWSKYASEDVVTSQMVLSDLLNAVCDAGSHVRGLVVAFLESEIEDSKTVSVVEQTPEQFNEALGLYTARHDKSWSFTDCASILILQSKGITDVLAHDHHFTQAGFHALMRD